jgi:hypothetical protein
MARRQFQMKIRIVCASILLPMLTAPLWADWGACDIGTSGESGVQIQADSATKADGSLNFTLSAGGAPLADKSDAIGFASGPAKMRGDCEIVIQILKISPGTQEWAAGGAMIRENFGTGAKFFAAGCTRTHGIQSFLRSDDDAAVTQQENCIDCNPPSWFKIVRQGNHFTSYKSMDGRIWLEVNEADVPMKKTVWAGAFITSGGGLPTADIVFAHVAARENSGQ